jgi:hypothetical protein
MKKYKTAGASPQTATNALSDSESINDSKSLIDFGNEPAVTPKEIQLEKELRTWKEQLELSEETRFKCNLKIAIYSLLSLYVS